MTGSATVTCRRGSISSQSTRGSFLHTYTQTLERERERQELRSEEPRRKTDEPSEKMTIGRSSRKGSVRGSIRAPKFLDKTGGFYCRLDEPGATEEGAGAGRREKAEDLGEGAMGDDGETLLQRKASRRSGRWRRSSRRKRREAEEEEQEEERGSGEVQAEAPGCQEVVIQVVEEEEEEEGGNREHALVHFAIREEADDRVLIGCVTRGSGGEDGEGEEERRAAKEQEEGMKMVKRMKAKSYRKALDRAFRRGWEAFIANLYSVTLTSATPTSPSSKERRGQGPTLDEFQVTARPL